MRIISEKELSKALSISRISISAWRKKGLPFLRMGKVIRYDLEKVLEWMKENSKGNK